MTVSPRRFCMRRDDNAILPDIARAAPSPLPKITGALHPYRTRLLPLSPEDRLGPYEIVAPLGAGGMGEVYRAKDPKLGREVAIKVLPAGVAQDAERLARFKREAQLLASLNHPNIAAIHGLEEAPGTSAGQPVTFLVLELVEGEDLAQRLTRGAIPPDETLAIGKQIAEALEIPLATVWTRLHKAREALRELLAERGLAPGAVALVLSLALPDSAEAAAAASAGTGAGAIARGGAIKVSALAALALLILAAPVIIVRSRSASAPATGAPTASVAVPTLLAPGGPQNRAALAASTAQNDGEAPALLAPAGTDDRAALATSTAPVADSAPPAPLDSVGLPDAVLAVGVNHVGGTFAIWTPRGERLKTIRATDCGTVGSDGYFLCKVTLKPGTYQVRVPPAIASGLVIAWTGEQEVPMRRNGNEYVADVAVLGTGPRIDIQHTVGNARQQADLAIGADQPSAKITLRNVLDKIIFEEPASRCSPEEAGSRIRFCQISAPTGIYEITFAGVPGYDKVVEVRRSRSDAWHFVPDPVHVNLDFQRYPREIRARYRLIQQ
jgi:hypothetical protein